MTANEREWLEEFEVFFDEVGLIGVSSSNIRTLIRLARANDPALAAENQAWDDAIERQEIIGRIK